MQIIKVGINSEKQYKYIISGIIAMLIFQQIQNIGMNIGLLPITGITLPFVSYGGSSLISYMIIFGIILNIANKRTNIISIIISSFIIIAGLSPCYNYS